VSKKDRLGDRGSCGFLRVVGQAARLAEQPYARESVPLKSLVELSGYRKTRWSFEDGWLILEAF
jgi:hypothetical protein